jgi:hypothetical protein
MLLRGSPQHDFHRPESMPGPASPAAECSAAAIATDTGGSATLRAGPDPLRSDSLRLVDGTVDGAG